MLKGHTDDVMAVAVLPDGNIVTASRDKTAINWSAEGVKKQVLEGHTGLRETVLHTVLQNGDIVTGSADNTAIIWSAEGNNKRVLENG